MNASSFKAWLSGYWQVSQASARRITIMLFVVVALVWLKNAWLCDDAYIMFRTVEQFWAGNGPVWNLHERVQVFTSVLWYAVLIVFWVLPFHEYIVGLLPCAVFFALALWMATRHWQTPWRTWAFVSIILGSKAIMDFSSSGLENPLIYFLAFAYMYYFIKATTDPIPAIRKANITPTSWMLGLLLLTRHDQLFLFAPPFFLLLWRERRQLRHVMDIVKPALAAVPLLLWTLFSFFYYGTPVPNTAIAKLNHGVPSETLWEFGSAFLFSHVYADPVSTTVILTAIILAFKRRRFPEVAMSIGMLIQTLYMAKIGGDFMVGRFFGSMVCVSLVLLLREGKEAQATEASMHEELNVDSGKTFAPIMLAPLVVLLGVCQFTFFWMPMTTPSVLNQRPELFSYPIRIADERYFYFYRMSLAAYVVHDHKDGDFLEGFGSYEAADGFVKNPVGAVLVWYNIGISGNRVGTLEDKPILDALALSDPLLARLPANPLKPFRAGHLFRHIPRGYPESIASGRNMIVDPDLRAYYAVVRLVTQSDDLWSRERLDAIWKLWTGYYDPLIEAYWSREPWKKRTNDQYVLGYDRSKQKGK